MKTRMLAMLLAVFLATTCVSLARSAANATEATKPQPPTLLIINHGPDNFSVSLNGSRIGSAMAGRSSCMLLRGMLPAEQQHLVLRAVSGSSIPAPVESLASAAGWRIVISQSPSIEIHSLQPAARCQP